MSCRVASFLCCRMWGVEVHLRRHKALWVRLSERETFIFDQSEDDTEEEVQPLQFCPEHRKWPDAVSTNTRYLLWFRQVSSNVTYVRTQESAKLVTCRLCGCDDKERSLARQKGCMLVLCYCTFLTGESDPAVQAAAAAVSPVALGSVLTLTGLCTVRPIMICSAVWCKTQMNHLNKLYRHECAFIRFVSEDLSTFFYLQFINSQVT